MWQHIMHQLGEIKWPRPSNLTANISPVKSASAYILSSSAAVWVIHSLLIINISLINTCVISWMSSSDTSSGKNLARNLNWRGVSFLTSWLRTYKWWSKAINKKNQPTQESAGRCCLKINTCIFTSTIRWQTALTF
jgi:hypothetical protein